MAADDKVEAASPQESRDDMQAEPETTTACGRDPAQLLWERSDRVPLKPRKSNDLLAVLMEADRFQEVPVVFGNPAAAAEGLGHEGEDTHAQRLSSALMR